ncbi:MAG: hypothetical protein K5774_06855 [Clostridia bacterium]|nr:hypothetical protein [Clostridia bacterium]
MPKLLTQRPNILQAPGFALGPFQPFLRKSAYSGRGLYRRLSTARSAFPKQKKEFAENKKKTLGGIDFYLR